VLTGYRMMASQGARMLQTLKKDGSTAAFSDRMVDHRGLWDLFDYSEWTDLEGRFAQK